MRHLFPLLCFISLTSLAQVSVSPEFPTADEEITIVYDATQGTSALQGAAKVLMHAGAILSGPGATNWEHVQGNWGDPGSVGAMTSLGGNKWQIKITPRSYFNVSDGTRIYRIGMVFRSAGPCGGFAGNNTPCKEGKSPTNSDIFIDLFEDNSLQIKLTEPAQFPLFLEPGEDFDIEAAISKPSHVILTIDGVDVLDELDVTSLSYSHITTSTPGTGQVVISADDGTETKETSFTYIVRSPVVNASRPPDIRPGITYLSGSAATVCLWAPMKTSVYVIGDFNQWKIDPQYLMKKDGEYFWLELSDLEPGKEYPFQYLVDEKLYVADPFADKILDPDDQFIPAETYPDLISYPNEALRDQWYYNRLSVLQTGQTNFTWSDQDYQKPSKENLVIYELLIRDFFGDGERNYQNLIDTLGYLKRLGVNAIELMPVTEFNGNDSWGYNPTFMFAPDKYYGTKNKLKELIDVCHDNGIAVILDVVMNQQDLPNPFVLMYYDFDNGRPSPTSPWFNVQATHPFNVFFDLNHESQYTQAYLDTVTYYWINEYHFDGYRFDLSKGYTQKDAGGDVNAWGQYDESRIAILKRMADRIWEHSPDAYVILEHFADNSEERELASYRADEGKGILLWGNLNNAYIQNTTGNAASDFSSIYHANRDWSEPHLIGYMESHDEERLMYRSLQNGKSAAGYEIKDPTTALERVKAANVVFLTIPGPKMIWQFGELGYDESINRCPDGTISDGCRVAAKPIHWDYQSNAERQSVYDHIRDLLRLRDQYDVFTAGSATISSSSSFVKQVTLKNSPYTESPADANAMNVQIAVNFDVNARSETISFPHSGSWFEYFSGETLTITNPAYNLTLNPGEYRLYTDYPLKEPITGIMDENKISAIIFPNPVEDEIQLNTHVDSNVQIFGLDGREVKGVIRSKDIWSLGHLAPGVYIIRMHTPTGVHHSKIVKR